MTITRNMYSRILTILVLLFALNAFGQNSEQRHYGEMMQDPEVNFYDVQAAFNAYWQGKDINQKEVIKGKGYKPYKRWEWFMEPRVYKTGERYSPDLLMKAYQEGQEKSMMAGGGGIWTYFGNTNVPNGGGAGRINMLEVDPNNPTTTWYACAPGGGLWKTTNSGTSWSLLNTDDLASIGVSDVAIDPSNTNVLYLGTGDGDAGDTYALGVLKSTDGGATWNPTGLSWTVQQARRVSRVIINPNNTQIVMAATSNGIYRTTDGGANWNQEISGNYKEIIFKPGDPNTVYCTGNSDDFWRSTDNGQNWTQITSGLPVSGISRLAIGVTDADPSIVYILAGSSATQGYSAFYRSTDSGVNFTEQHSMAASSLNLLGWDTGGGDTGGQAWYDLCTAGDPLDANTVYVGGVNVYKSTDGGVNWALTGHWYGGGGAPYVHADNHGMVFIPGTSTLLIGNDGGVFRTTNGGSTFSDRSSNLEVAQQYRIGISQQNSNQLLTGWQDNGTNYKNGAAWSEVIGGDGFECIMDHTNSSVAYGALYYGNIRKSTSGAGGGYGTIVGSGGTGVNSNGAWLTPYIMSGNDNLKLLVGKSTVYTSLDGGGSWAAGGAIAGGNINALAMAPSNEDYIFASKGGSLYMSYDGGATFAAATGMSGDYITYIAFDPANEDRVWITYSGFSSGTKVYFSSNGGASWSNFSTGLPNIPVNCIAYHTGSSDALYVGTDAGVYYRDNSFSSWQSYSSGLPNVVVTELEIQYASNTIVCSTYGRGVWHAPLFSLPQLDGAVTSIVFPSGTLCDPNFAPQITVGNFGADAITAMTIEYSTTGGPTLTYNWTGSINTGETDTFVAPSMNGGLGAFTFTASVIDVNGGGLDDSALNDTQTSDYYVSGNDNTITLNLLTDCWASESSWEVTNGLGDVVHSGSGYLNDTNYLLDLCLADGCYTFTMYDSYGDGLSGADFGGCGANGNYIVTDEGGQVLGQMQLAYFGFSEYFDFCVPYIPTPGCTNSFADNYNSLADTEDGSCVFSCNYINFEILTDCWGGEVSWDLVDDATATVIASVAGNTLASSTLHNWEYCLPDGCYTLTINDSFGDGLSGIASGCAIDGDYSVVEYGGNVLVQMATPNYGSQVIHNFCFAGNEGCTDTSACNYDSTAVTDDGSCQYLDACGVCGGSGTVAGCTDNSACNYNAAANCDNGSCQYLDACGVCGGSGTVAGCTDNSACNYNAAANCDNGSCQYLDACGVCGGSGTVAGCTDNSACNYNAAANCDNGSCQYLDACGVCGGSGTVAGCTDNSACNYNAAANCDNGSCQYLDACGVCGGSGTVAGCTDNSACNYNAAANCDDGSCQYLDTCGVCGGSGTIAGCTDGLACNYDSTADCDDGSCDYAICSCLGDFDLDLDVDTSDLLILLAGFSCQSNCAVDMNGDDAVNTQDLLIFLSVFGQPCI
jgi:hypothetical protein